MGDKADHTQNGFKLKTDKEHSLIGTPADITGVIVRNGKLKLPNRQLKKLAELVQQRKTEAEKTELAKLDNRIRGRLAQRRQIESADMP